MTDNLNSLLEMLKRQILEGGGATLIPQKVIEQQFHGLTLHQLVLLTDAPALGVMSEIRDADGARAHSASIEGRDARQCEAVARRLLLDDRLVLGVGDTLQVSVADDGGAPSTRLRDHDGAIYRILDDKAVVDEELTAVFRGQRRRTSVAQPGAQHPDAVDASGLRGMASEVLEGLAAVRVRNGAMVEAIQKMIWSAGERALRPACEVASPQLLEETFEQIVAASRQLEALLDGLMQRTRALLPQANEPQDAAAGQLQAPISVHSTPAADLPTEPSGAVSFTWHPRESQPF